MPCTLDVRTHEAAFRLEQCLVLFARFFCSLRNKKNLKTFNDVFSAIITKQLKCIPNLNGKVVLVRSTFIRNCPTTFDEFSVLNTL